MNLNCEWVELSSVTGCWPLLLPCSFVAACTGEISGDHYAYQISSRGEEGSFVYRSQNNQKASIRCNLFIKYHSVALSFVLTKIHSPYLFEYFYFQWNSRNFLKIKKIVDTNVKIIQNSGKLESCILMQVQYKLLRPLIMR